MSDSSSNSSDSEEERSRSIEKSKHDHGDDDEGRSEPRSDDKIRGRSSSKSRGRGRSSPTDSRKRSRSRSRNKSASPGELRRRRNRDRSPIERKRDSPPSKSRKNDRSRTPSRKRRRSTSREVLKEKQNSLSPKRSKSPVEPKVAPPAKKKEDLLTTKTGGAYIPPAKLRMMQQNITDKSSEAYQRLAWEALKKSINGLINKVNSPNIAVIVRELFAENIVRGRGLLCQSIIQAQTASPTFTHVYAALAAIINTKFPNIGELLLKRLILNFKRGFKRNDKTRCTSSVRFIAHMVNQQVAHEVLSLEILTLLLENPTDDSAEVAITFLKEVGQKLSEVSPRGIHAIFERLRHVLHESTLDKRTQYMIEVMFQVRKDGFKDNPSVPEELDLVEEDDQFTHMITLDDATGGEEILNVFKHDPDYEDNETKYGAIKAELLEEDSGDSSGSGSGSDSDSSDDEDASKAAPIVDATETNLISLRRTIYLTIQSALDFEEAVHKMLKLNIKPGQEAELCHMIIDCCAQQRTYEKFFGLMGQRFCQVTKTYQEPFSQIFLDTYNTVHRLETGKLRNVAKFYAHLLYTDAIDWSVLSVIKLNEDDTTSSSRIYIKILFQELAEFMGLAKLVERTRDGTMAEAWEGLLPRDNPRDTRFAINFFTSIGLGGITEDLRSHLKTAPKPTAVVAPMVRGKQGSSESSSDSSSSSTDSEEERRRRKKKEKKKARKGEEKRRKNRDRSESVDSENEMHRRKRNNEENRKESDKNHDTRIRRSRMSSSEDESRRNKRRNHGRIPKVKSEPESDDDKTSDRRRRNRSPSVDFRNQRIKRESSEEVTLRQRRRSRSRGDKSSQRRRSPSPTRNARHENERWRRNERSRSKDRPRVEKRHRTRSNDRQRNRKGRIVEHEASKSRSRSGSERERRRGRSRSVNNESKQIRGRSRDDRNKMARKYSSSPGRDYSRSVSPSERRRPYRRAASPSPRRR